MRRFRTRRRFGGKPVQRQQLSWVTTLFNETAVPVNAATTASQVLLDDNDWRGNVASLRQVAVVKRIMYRGVFMWVPNSTAQAGDMCSVVWAVWIADEVEDPIAAATFNSTAENSVFQEKRVVHSDVIGFTALETAGFIVNSVDGIRCDVDWKGGLKVQPGERIAITFCFQGTAVEAVSVAAVSAISRVLIVTP